LLSLGPLIGAMTRAGSGWIADRYGGGRVTIWVFIIMMIGALGVLYFLENKELSYAFHGFFAMFLLLFAATGVGNASTFQMIPTIFRTERGRALKGQPDESIRKAAELEGAATIGFSSAIGAFGAFFIPKKLWHIHRSDRYAQCGFGRVLCVLRNMPTSDVVVLHP
jgi:NNP family nitrate/nitrite transporter-like MFS transporter